MVWSSLSRMSVQRLGGGVEDQKKQEPVANPLSLSTTLKKQPTESAVISMWKRSRIRSSV